MRKSFKDSLKALEADIQLANTLASDYPREYDGACLQMRLSYSPAAQFFLFFLSQAYENGKTTMSIHERKASLKEFYSVIFPPYCNFKGNHRSRREETERSLCHEVQEKDEFDKGKISEIDSDREEECDICMEMISKVVLPNCNHSMCIKCYRNWRSRSQSCPFCRDSLKRVNSGDLWIYTSSTEVVDLSAITRENLKRLFMYIEKLPFIVPDPAFVSYDPLR
ncbi:hypothetical protein FNV43_RR10302 [Rhamnella rubrinervis]|uniref:RING-type domain-containing protein n=1 Tax=Rhamnella rubrinervis TaxID=2594499 RepID=A0A8K0ML06_9ROSA|nr:hypothetical protein FNV43_RR10302 [Rhamnella rubrinervis]